jgi:hypothetical protein
MRRPTLSVGDDDAIPSKKICPCPGTHWACDGWSGKRIVCCRPCGVKHRSVHVPGLYSNDDDWWRSWVLPGNRYSASGFSCSRWSAFEGRLQRQGRFCRIPQRRRHVSRYIDGFCIGHPYRASSRCAHLLDSDDHAGMGGWRVDANCCRGDCAHAPLILVAFASRRLCLCADFA